MNYTLEEYEVLKQRHLQITANLGEAVSGYTVERISGLKEVLEMLPQYDEYYSINDLRKLEFDWCFGVERVLGYDSKTWTHYDSIRVIHEDFRRLFLIFGALAYRIIIDENPLSPKNLKHPYIVNVPMQTKGGTYLWVKQMSMPLQLDANGMMVKQFNGFTAVSPFEDVFLPLCPRIFMEDGSQAPFLEKRLLEHLVGMGELQFNATHMRILKAYFDVDQEQILDKEEKRKGKQRVAITSSDVLGRVGLTTSMLKKESQKIVRRMKEVYGVTFPNIYHVAMFFKPLFYTV
jgi:hypothetical protein